MRETEIQEKLKKLEQNPLVGCDGKPVVQPADGTTVGCTIAHMEEGLLAGDPVTYVMGFADIGTDLFDVNAGGLTGRLDSQDALDLIGWPRFGPAR